jgi:hypothetical protein
MAFVRWSTATADLSFSARRARQSSITSEFPRWRTLAPETCLFFGSLGLEQSSVRQRDMSLQNLFLQPLTAAMPVATRYIAPALIFLAFDVDLFEDYMSASSPQRRPRRLLGRVVHKNDSFLRLIASCVAIMVFLRRLMG